MTPSGATHRLTWRETPVWLRCGGVIALINFGAFILGDLWLGGDAMNGGVRNGRYFLRSHGQITEVSAGVYRYSLVHGVTAMLGIMAFMAAAMAFRFYRERREHR